MKHGLLFLIFSFFCADLQAQDQKLRLGAQAGVNLFKITDDPNLRDSDFGLSTQIGVFARIGDRFYVQPGLELMSNKTKVERELLTETVRDELAIRYFRIPVMLGIKLIEGEGIASHFRVLFGPSFSYAINVKDNNLDYELDDVRKSVFALNGGIGFDLWLLNIDLLYHRGVSTVLKAGTSEGEGRAVSMTIGFRI